MEFKFFVCVISVKVPFCFTNPDDFCSGGLLFCFVFLVKDAYRLCFRVVMLLEAWKINRRLICFDILHPDTRNMS
jgi:hypothetical protein